MKLRTSFFNGKVLLKNLTRFAPVWILFAVAEVLGLMSLDLDNSAYTIANDLRYIIGPVGIAHCGYALIVAACLFGDLFDSRLCNGLHAMPMRREGWLLTNLASGFLFALIPAFVGGAVAAVALESEWWLALVWQGTSLLQYLFFFGVAVFSAMCAGKRIGMIAIYGILNFLSMLVSWVADIIFVPLLPGVVLPTEQFETFSPVVAFCGDSYIDYYCDRILGGVFHGVVVEDCIYLGICAGVGVAFLVLAWLLYRKRNLETAGDFVSFRPMGSFFLLTYTLGMGTLVYTFAELFFGTYKDYGFLVVGIVIGWFTGWMLLERTVKIFTKKVLIGFVAFVAVFAGCIGLTIADPMGITAYVPETGEIKEANLYLQNDVYYYLDEDETWGGRHITDPEEVEQVRQYHTQLINTPQNPQDEYMTVYVRYRLQDNRLIYRTYKVPAGSQTAENLRPFFSDPRSVFNVDDWQQLKDSVASLCVYWRGDKLPTELYTPELVEGLMNAIEADCYAGTFTQHDYFHTGMEYLVGIDVQWNENLVEKVNGDIARRYGEHVVAYEDSVHVAAFLETLDPEPIA